MDWSGHEIGDVVSWGRDMLGSASGLRIRDGGNGEGAVLVVSLEQILDDCAEDAHRHHRGLDSGVCQVNSCDDDGHDPCPCPFLSRPHDHPTGADCQRS